MDDIVSKIEECLKRHDKKPRKVDTNKYKKVASVLIPLVNFNGVYNLLMTKRTGHLKNHSGEISFPGGSKDPDDVDLLATALRELKEEVGIDEVNVRVLGSLQNEFSVSYFTVKPFVGYIRDFSYDTLILDRYEVEKILLIPIGFFLDKRNEWREVWVRNDEKHINFFYNYNGDIIWGLSGRIIKIFVNAIKGCLY